MSVFLKSYNTECYMINILCLGIEPKFLACKANVLTVIRTETWGSAPKRRTRGWVTDG